MILHPRQFFSWTFCILWVCLFWGGIQPAFAADQPAKTRKALVIGIDGCRFDALKLAKAPACAELQRTGLVCLGTEILAERETPGDTVSGPGWSNLLTGVWPDKHGVIDNSFRGSQYEKYPSWLTRLGQVAPARQCFSFSTWHPIAEKILADFDQKHLIEAKKLEDYIAGDQELTQRAVQELGKPSTDVVFLYLGQVDETGHRHGFHPKVPQYLAALETVDQYVGQVVSAVRQRATYPQEDWLILICTDHGGSGTGHGGGRNNPDIRRTFLIVHAEAAPKGVTERPTFQVDVAATVFDHLQIPVPSEWQLDGRSLLQRKNVEPVEPASLPPAEEAQP